MSQPARRRLCIVPRWAGAPSSDFYPWLSRAVVEVEPKLVGEASVIAMPSPSLPTIEDWVGRLNEVLGADPAFASETILLGHSVGCQAILRYLAQLPLGVRYAGVLLVAGWLWVDKPWDTIKPWTETPFDLSAAKAATSKLVVLLSTDDPFTADYDENRCAWEERASAEVILESGGLHFNKAEEPAVLAAFQRSFAV